MRFSSGAVTIVFLAFAATSLPGVPQALAQGQPLLHTGACPLLLDQVCARSRKKTLVTYANECTARGDRAKVVSKGPCPDACPMIYSPVCAIDESGYRKTYGNACQAKAAGARVLSDRRCGLTLRKK